MKNKEYILVVELLGNHLLKTGYGSGWHFLRAICYDVTGQYGILLTSSSSEDVVLRLFSLANSMCCSRVEFIFSAGGSSWILNWSLSAASKLYFDPLNALNWILASLLTCSSHQDCTSTWFNTENLYWFVQNSISRIH